MNISNNQILIIVCCVFGVFACACNIETKKTLKKNTNNEHKESTINKSQESFVLPSISTTPTLEEQISPFIRRIHQDSKGDYWFGTNGDGVVRYNGQALDYLNVKQGFAGSAVRQIIEDEKQILWFGTNGGLSRYDPNPKNSDNISFTNYREEDGLVNNDIWSMMLDRNGNLWIGTYKGVSVFDGKTFSDFELPETEIDPTRGVTSTKIVHDIMEDKSGSIWFATNGGVFIYTPDQNSNKLKLKHISVENGLCNNVVNDLLQDKNGAVWFATHHNGVCRLNAGFENTDDYSFTHFGNADGVEGIEVWSLYEDNSGTIWFPSEGYGVYKFDSELFSNFNTKDGLYSNAIQSIYEDNQGIIWFGGYMGLYRFNPKLKNENENTIINVTKWQLEH